MLFLLVEILFSFFFYGKVFVFFLFSWSRACFLSFFLNRYRFSFFLGRFLDLFYFLFSFMNSHLRRAPETSLDKTISIQTIKMFWSIIYIYLIVISLWTLNVRLSFGGRLVDVCWAVGLSRSLILSQNEREVLLPTLLSQLFSLSLSQTNKPRR